MYVSHQRVEKAKYEINLGPDFGLDWDTLQPDPLRVVHPKQQIIIDVVYAVSDSMPGLFLRFACFRLHKQAMLLQQTSQHCHAFNQGKILANTDLGALRPGEKGPSARIQ